MVSIIFDKKMRTFEDYSHDPERGDDFVYYIILISKISLPVQFTSTEKNITELYFTENQVTHIPAPDFSMPFNILTFTCITLGYYFLQILKFSVDK
jgi:phosphatidylinositol glycan class T